MLELLDVALVRGGGARVGGRQRSTVDAKSAIAIRFEPCAVYTPRILVDHAVNLTGKLASKRVGCSVRLAAAAAVLLELRGRRGDVRLVAAMNALVELAAYCRRCRCSSSSGRRRRRRRRRR